MASEIHFYTIDEYFNYKENLAKSCKICWLLYEFHFFNDSVDACFNIQDCLYIILMHCIKIHLVYGTIKINMDLSLNFTMQIPYY